MDELLQKKFETPVLDVHRAGATSTVPTRSGLGIWTMCCFDKRFLNSSLFDCSTSCHVMSTVCNSLCCRMN